MEVKINGETRKIHPLYAPILVEQFMNLLEQGYYEIDPLMRWGADKVAKGYAKKFDLPKEQANLIGCMEHLFTQALDALEEVGVELTLDAEGYVLVKPYGAIPEHLNRAGRRLLLHGEQGEREDDSGEEDRVGVVAALPESEAESA